MGSYSFLPGDIVFDCNYRPLSFLKEDDAAQEGEDGHQLPHSNGVHTGKLSDSQETRELSLFLEV